MTALLIFAEIDAKAIILAKIGVEQGVPISANTAPRSKGYRKSLFILFLGISFITTGISNSIISRIFKPIIIIMDAIIRAKYGFPTNILPVNAQIPPKTEKTIPVPKTKKIIWTRVFKGFASENPPMYPMISGSIDNEHGEIDDNKPPKNDAANKIYMLCCVENNWVKLSIILDL